MKKTLLVSVALLGSSSIALANTDFSLAGKPIAPQCLAAFNDVIQSSPYATSINLDDCQKASLIDPSAITNQSGYQSFYHHHDKSGRFGSYGYQMIGKTKQGVYVVKTRSSGGGSGTFTQLMLLKLDQGHLFSSTQSSETPKAQTYTRLNFLGQIQGGDRCFGDVTDILLKGDTLTFKKYQGKTAVDCSKTQSYSVDLSQLG